MAGPPGRSVTPRGLAPVFGVRVQEQPWEELLGRWWPRLLPGAAASATHGLIRSGHAVPSAACPRDRTTPGRARASPRLLGRAVAADPVRGPPRGALAGPAAWTRSPRRRWTTDWGARRRQRFAGWRAGRSGRRPRGALRRSGRPCRPGPARQRGRDPLPGSRLGNPGDARPRGNRTPRRRPGPCGRPPRPVAGHLRRRLGRDRSHHRRCPSRRGRGVRAAEGGVEATPPGRRWGSGPPVHGDEHVIKFAEVAPSRTRVERRTAWPQRPGRPRPDRSARR